jgi:hypothetical protein
MSAYDFETTTRGIRNLRAGFLSTALNDGKLQFRYDNGTTVTWYDLMTGLTSVSFNFTSFWDYTTEKKELCLMVNGTSFVYEWTGATTTVASATTNTVTKQGTTTWAEEGFYVAGTRSIIIGGVPATYTGGEGTDTLTGVSVDFSAVVAGTVTYQAVRTTANSGITGLPAAMKNDLISILRNQVYYGSFSINDVYVSKVNNYKDCGFTSPVRVVGEGALLSLISGTLKAFVPQEDAMYFSAGQDQWYQTKMTLSSDNAKEELTVIRLKTGAKQAAQSQALTSKDKNNVIFVSNEPAVTALGRVQNIYQTPQMTDYSFPIVDDMNDYDFTNGQVFYFKNFIYVSVPKHSVVLIYNQTNPENSYWEAPQLLPISRFYVVDGELYGHSYLTGESYKLFTGYNDNGNEIDCRALFAYNNYGSRFSSKGANELYVEGYITQNGTLKANVQWDIDGCSTFITNDIAGDDTRIVCLGGVSNSLGKNSLGKQPLGSSTVSQATLPPKFRVIKTFTQVPFFEEQTSFTSVQKDFQWEIIAFGLNATITAEGNNSITI